MVFFAFLIVAWILLLSILLWDLIQKGQNKIYMFVLIPSSLLLTVTTYVTIQGLLGYPTESIKKGKFILLSSAVKEPDWVYYWVIHEGDKDPIAYKVPYSKPEHQKQEQASGKMEQGQMIEGEFKTGEENDAGEGTKYGEFEFYDFDFTKKLPKGTE